MRSLSCYVTVIVINCICPFVCPLICRYKCIHHFTATASKVDVQVLRDYESYYYLNCPTMWMGQHSRAETLKMFVPAGDFNPHSIQNHWLAETTEKDGFSSVARPQRPSQLLHETTPPMMNRVVLFQLKMWLTRTPPDHGLRCLRNRRGGANLWKMDRVRDR